VSRRLLRRLAAALAAAAAVWTIVAAGLGGHGPVVVAALAAAVAAAGAYVALGPPPRRDALRSFGVGLAAQAGALYVVYALWVLTGCTSSTPGHIDAWMWSVGLAVIAAVDAWALRRPRLTWWLLPVATILGAMVIAVLAIAVNGSTGYCVS
jgi:hypothetical protein